MLWGIVNGLCNIVEKLLKDNRYYIKIPKILKWSFTMVVVYFSWQLFRFESLYACKEWFMTMFGMNELSSVPYSWLYYFDTRMIALMFIGGIGATLWGIPKVQTIYQKVVQTKCGYLMNELLILVLFILSILFMVNSNYSPFIYFQY